MTSESGTEPRKKVAVIAVHGVSDQRPRDSAYAIADLLLQHSSDQYTQFREQSIRFTVKPIEVRSKVAQETSKVSNEPSRSMPKRSMQEWFDERGKYLRQGLDQEKGDDLKPSYRFMLDKLWQFRQPAVAYDSICLQGTRHDGSSSIDVDIYEMYWADLSRLGSGFVRIFGEFYQLLFHLISLGRQSVDYACLEHRVNNPIWRGYGDIQAIAGRLLALVVPILNLYLLLIALLSLPGNLPASVVPFLICGGGGLGVLFLTGWLCLHWNLTQFKYWLLIPFGVGILICLAIKFGISQFASQRWMHAGYLILTIAWEVLLAVIITVVLILPFDRHRKGAAAVAVIAGVPIALMAFTFLFTMPTDLTPHEQLTWASFRTIEGLYAILFASWVGFILVYLLSVILGGIVTLNLWAKEGFDRKSMVMQRVIRATWTARISLALPALLFSLLTLSLWTAFAQVGTALLPKGEFYRPWLLFVAEGKTYTPEKFAHRLTVFSGSQLLIFIMVAIVIVVGIVLWALLPSASTEVQPPPSADPGSGRSASLGQWLSNGFWLMVYVIDFIICFAIPIMMLMGVVDAVCYLLTWQPIFFTDPNTSTTEFLLSGVAGVLTASATGLVAFGNRLNQVTVGFRGVLDAMLDVDNYLRTSPAEDTPTARIFARYISLLRYISQNREQYDAVVIISHSQGTVISADLLRFLQQQSGNQCNALNWQVPIYLFTMGSPLRQLYSFAFPHLYGWVEQENADPELFSVRKWVNAYRSGDYIGRNLWDRSLDEVWQVFSADPPDPSQKGKLISNKTIGGLSCQEFCIGAGGHTHYWDKYAPVVALKLNQLIRESVNKIVE
jgi:hypothetical protein